jgi:hypothetical protein
LLHTFIYTMVLLRFAAVLLVASLVEAHSAKSEFRTQLTGMGEALTKLVQRKTSPEVAVAQVLEIGRKLNGNAGYQGEGGNGDDDGGSGNNLGAICPHMVTMDAGAVSTDSTGS